MKKRLLLTLSLFASVFAINAQQKFNEAPDLSKPVPFKADKQINEKTPVTGDKSYYYWENNSRFTYELNTFLGATSAATGGFDTLSLYTYSVKQKVNGTATYWQRAIQGIPTNDLLTLNEIKFMGRSLKTSGSSNMNVKVYKKDLTTLITSQTLSITNVYNYQTCVFSTPATDNDTMFVVFEMATVSDSFKIAKSHSQWNNYNFGTAQSPDIFTSALPFQGDAAILAYGVNNVGMLGLIAQNFDFFVIPKFSYALTSSFAASTSTICLGSPVTFTNSANTSLQKNPILNYAEWDHLANAAAVNYTNYDFGNSTPKLFSATQIGTYTYPAAGTYTVKSKTQIDSWITAPYRFEDSVSIVVNVVDPATVPTFTQVPPICSGAALTLPASSTNSFGITGTWLPAVNNLATTSYTFTPGAGQCTVNTASMTVNVTPTVTPTFAQIPAFCSGTAAPTLLTLSTNSITGTWNSAIDNLAIGQTTYTFTPSGGTCVNNATMPITVTQTVIPTFTILNNICTGATAPTLPPTSNNANNAISGTWNPPTVSNTQTGDYTFTATTGTCITSPVVTVTVNQTPTTPAFTAIPAFCSGAQAPTLPLISTNSITGTWNSAVSNSTIGQTNYTFTPTAGACATTATLPVTVTETVTPTFTQIPAFCSGAAAPSLPSASNNLNNAIQGAWSPLTVSNSILGATTYTFTPSSGTCVNTATMSITVNTSTVPTFSIPTSLCTGATAPLLPSTSTNLISGSWNPSTVSNTASLPYVFTPTGNACLSPLTINITVGQTVTPTFATLAPICLGGTAPLLPTTSTNNVTGTWLPSVVSNLATNTYTFTPTTSCANTYSALVTVSANSVPSFNLSTAICTGASAPILPTTSLELIPGTWSPSIVSNIATGVYVFTPTLGVCASNKTQLITVSAVIVPTFNLPSIVCVGSVAPQLLPVSTNAITGVWSPSSISTTTSLSYLFTPSAGACASLLATSIAVSSCAGLEENSVSKYSISPNPSSDVISISFSELSENNGVVKFFSTDGKIIEERNYTNSSVETFDVKSLNAGVYFFQIGNSIEKVVVQ